MGGGGSKKAQLLDKHGQLYSPEEKEAIQACFLAITRSEEAETFTEDQLKVRIIYDCWTNACAKTSILL